MEGRWCSAADVAADLSRAGGGVAPPAPLAGACLAWGARPEPFILTEACPPPARAPPPRAAPPDLRGITQMLRMVQTDGTNEDSSAPGDMVISKLGRPPAPPRRPPATSPGARPQLTTTVRISELNPNVAEFVPRGCAGAGGREERAARLREEISGGRDTCGAIARLMRLYAEPAARPAEPAPLLTPDYFERAAAAITDGDSSPTTETASERFSVGSHCVSPMMCPRQPEEARTQPDPEVRASVDKVRRWLGDGDAKPARAPTPRLLLDPVPFRARAHPARSPPPAPAPSPATRAYSPPAEAAAALQREYAARAAAALAAAPAPPAGRTCDTLWSRVEASLRQRQAEP